MKNSILITGMFMMVCITFFVTPVLSQITNFIPRTIYYQDLDGDGFGNPLKTIHATTPPVGYVLIDGDCDDTDSKITSSLLFRYFHDKDKDGLGDGEEAIRACVQPKGYVMNGDDCDDNDAKVGKGILYVYYRDLDGDGYGDINFYRITCSPPKGYVSNFSDCDDRDPNFVKGYTNFYFPDEDLDGYGNGNEGRYFCSPPKGWVDNGNDCDDHNPKIGKEELNYYFKDFDQDGYPSSQFWVNSCEAPAGFVKATDVRFDCDDNDKAVGAGELSSWFVDRDQDGLGDGGYSIYSCLAPKGFVDNYKDCDDSNSKIGESRYYYVDNDNDGYGDLSGTTYSCGAPKGYVDNYDDCDDHDKNVGSGVNKQYWLDYDRDGLGDPNKQVSTCKPPKYGVENNLDCNDSNPNILGARYFYQDLDNDGFGGDIFQLTCKPDKGFISIDGDCNDKNSKIYPGANEICNGLDDNCNGSIDEGDVLVSIVGATNGYYMDGYLCADAKPQILKGNPAGGTFSIDGVVTTILDPANFKLFDGIHKIEYAVKVDGCVVKVYAVFKKFKVTEPIIYGLKENYFQSDASIILSPFDTTFAIYGNSYFGVFSIDGLKTKLFNPSTLDTGVHIIAFTIIQGGCQAVTNKVVRIVSPKTCPFFPIQGICYKIVNKYSRKVLTVKRGSLSDGAIVTQSDFNNYPYQKWNIAQHENGTYSIYSLNSSKQIEAYTYLGTAVLQRDTTSNFPLGSWKIACTDRAGYYKIINYNNGHVMDIMAHTESTGAQAITWYWTGSDFQYWQIVPVDCNADNSALIPNARDATDNSNRLESERELTIFPNPAHDHTIIKTRGLSNSSISIYDPLGRMVYQSKLLESNETININLSPSHFSPGLYIVKAEGQGELITRKLLVN